MSTAYDLILAAFRKVGVQSPDASKIANALTSLNNMLGMWGADRLVYCVTTEAFSCSSADSEYTIGDGGQWNTVRPNSIERCFLRDSDNYDHPVDVNLASKDYNYLSNKSYTGRPGSAYFLPEYPLAKLIFNSSPDTDYDVYLEMFKPWTELASTSAAFTAPAEYKEGVIYNLAVSLGEDWDRIIPKTVIAKAEEYKYIIKHLIASQRKTPKAKFDIGAMGGVGQYNIATDDLIDGGA